MSSNLDSNPSGGYLSKGWEIRLGICLAMILLGLGTIFTYLKPATEANRVLLQSDILQGMGMSKEINDFRKASKGEEPLWTSRLFGGMPAYQVNTLYEGNLFRKIDKILKLEFLVPPVIGIMFLCFLGMFILLLALKVDPFTSAMGAMAFMMGSYLLTLLEAGHNSKINTVAYVPMTLAGISLAYRGRLFLGGALSAFAIALSINANHIQTTYYGMFIIGLAVVSYIAFNLLLIPRIVLLSVVASLPLQWYLGMPKTVWIGSLGLAFVASFALQLFFLKKGDAMPGLMAFLKGKDLVPSTSKFRSVILGSLVVLVAAGFAAGTNYSRMVTNQEYLPETMRGGVVLKRLQPETEGNGNGLTKEYAYQWSNAVAESFTIVNPYYMGDATSSDVGKDSRTHSILERNLGARAADYLSENWPTYYGGQPFTSGPNFIGSVIFFLFILGLFAAPDKYRWYLLTATILGIMLSWGRYFQGFSDLFFDNLPLYNKFRSVSSMMMIAEVAMPVLAALGVSWYIRNPRKNTEQQQLMTLGLAAGITVFILVVLWALAPGTRDFTTPLDAQRITKIWSDVGAGKISPGVLAELQAALTQDRASMFTGGFLRAFLFVFLAGGLLFVADRFIRKSATGANGKTMLQAVVGVGLLVLVMAELIPVDLRYVDKDDFETKQEFLKRFNPTPADNAILSDKDPNFRVLNLTRDPWNDAISCYHHKMVGGYHPAKLRRYNDLITQFFSPEIQAVGDAMGKGDLASINAALSQATGLRMMNTKYIIYHPEQAPLPAPARLGNAWIVSDAVIAKAKDASETDADVAIDQLHKVDIAKTMVVESEFADKLAGFSPARDSGAAVVLTSFAPNAVSYDFRSSNGKEQLVVFSEVYYNSGKGWQAYLDGKPVEHFRCNYVLRGMRVPAGNHKIEFKFEPASFKKGYMVDLAVSGLLLAVIAGLVFLDLRQRSKDSDEEDDTETA